MSKIKTHCERCGGKLRTSVAAAQPQYVPNCSPADDVNYLLRKADLLMANAMADTGVPSPPAILLVGQKPQQKPAGYSIHANSYDSHGRPPAPEPFELIAPVPFLLAK